MGSRLRNLMKKSGKSALPDGKSIDGQGRLTKKCIDSLQVYYGRAIRDNTESVPAMKNAVMAILLHSRSTDQNPDHQLCQKGKDSWCGFQRDLENETTLYDHKHPLPADVADAIQPVCIALSAESLLRGCLHG